ncbi:hypothetical protein FA13DRAFT_1622266 [Coprinellus micaceus]|uniref:C2H2-type domain-containing protein n=1 Tax=Coprinellus micaceus TaxID=71717 RepID=A0A4Y7TT95_COPMI|nr:hypothetical protein FA13DRAFT_1622266 [Coprinellus micaceus]
MDRRYDPDDDDRTPIARYPPPTLVPAYIEEPPAAKYECQYCGKGFNRPSSLKIHLNSHTGEKPFACPVEGCGRSFSVLSNMRRHARVHTQPGDTEKEATGDASDHPAINETTGASSLSSSSSSKDPKWHQRRGSVASTSSSASRRSRSESSEDEDEERPEKRSRQ